MDDEVPEQVLLDENKEAEGMPFYMTGGIAVSPDESLLAYTVDNVGSEKFSLCVRNLETGESIEQVLIGSIFQM